MCNTIKNAMASAAETETGGIFMGRQRCVQMRITAIKLGHYQPSNITSFYSDNKTAKGILTSTVRQKNPKAFDMHFYWMPYRIAQKQFYLIWRSGALNMVDYFTKHHPS